MLHKFGAPRRLLWFVLGVVAIVAVAGIAMGSGTSSKAPSTASTAGASPLVAAAPAGQAFSAQLVGTVDMASVPQETAAQASAKSAAQLPILTSVSARAYAALKASAAHSSAAPDMGAASALGSAAVGTAPGPKVSAAQTAVTDPGGTQTPGVKAAFVGMSDSGTTCKFFGSGCQPSDMATAASGHNVVQAVNTSIAVYSPSGSLRPGFPKDIQAFLGVPNPSPSGCSQGNGAFLSDPRLAYDTNDQRFFFSIMEVENLLGINPGCNVVARDWIAVSASSNPAGAWHIYSIDQRFGDTTVAPDFTMMGYDQQAVYWSFDMFTASGSAYVRDNFFSLDKAALEAGASASGFFFQGVTVGGVQLDHIQPVISYNRSGGPNTEYLVAAFDFNFGGGLCSSGCSGEVLLSFANSLGKQSSGPRLTGLVIGTAGYSLPPAADNGGACNNCIDTGFTGMSSTPVYHSGRVYSAITTGINNGTTVVPGILWTNLRPRLDHGVGSCTLCVGLTGSSSLEDQGYFFYSGRGDAYYPTLVTDDEGNAEMVFNFSGNGSAPSVAYSLRRISEAPGAFSNGGLCLLCTSTPTGDSRWGDYSAAGWTGPDNNTLWIAGEFSNGDWSTVLGQLGLPLTSPTVAQP